MSQRPPDSGVTGIMGLFFREWGLFWEQTFKWAEDRANQAQLEAGKRDEVRRMEAEAKLLEQLRLAKEAGLDVNAVLAQSREEQRRLS